MKQKSGPGKAPAEQVVKDIRRQTRRNEACWISIDWTWQAVSLLTVCHMRPLRRHCHWSEDPVAE